MIKLQKAATSFGVSYGGGQRGGMGGSSQPLLEEGYGAACLGRTLCEYASTKMEVRIPVTRKLEAVQWLYKEALVGRTRFHAPSIDEG